MDANQRAAELIDLLGPLIDLLDEETALLHELSAPEIAALQQEKAGLAESYRRAVAAAAADPAFAASLDPALRDELNALQEELQQALAENEPALRAAITASQKLIASIVGAAKDVQSDGTGYTRQGGTGKQPGPAVAVRINRRL